MYFPKVVAPADDESSLLSVDNSIKAKDGESWALRFESRIGSRLTKDEAVKIVGDIMSVNREAIKDDEKRPLHYPVNLSNEDLSIIAESNALFVGISICRNYMIKWKKFNVKRLCDERTTKDSQAAISQKEMMSDKF